MAMGGIRRREAVGQLAQSGVVTATTLWVLAAASAFAWILVREWVPQMLGEWIASVGAGRSAVHGDHRRALRRRRRAARRVAGAADLRSHPVPHQPRLVGIDPVHYGIVIVAAMGIAFFLPPVGVGLSIAAGIARVDIDDVSRSYVPYLIALLIGLALIAAFPVITLVLPRILLGYKG